MPDTQVKEALLAVLWTVKWVHLGGQSKKEVFRAWEMQWSHFADAPLVTMEVKAIKKLPPRDSRSEKGPDFACKKKRSPTKPSATQWDFLIALIKFSF